MTSHEIEARSSGRGRFGSRALNDGALLGMAGALVLLALFPFVNVKFLNQCIAILMLLALVWGLWVNREEAGARVAVLFILWVVIHVVPVDLAIRDGPALRTEVLPVKYEWPNAYAGPERCMLYQGLNSGSDVYVVWVVDVRWAVVVTLPVPWRVRTPFIQPAELHEAWVPPRETSPTAKDPS